MFLPWWQTERIARRLRSRRPDAVLVIRLERGQRVVAHPCARSHRAGVRAGMNLSQARVLLAGRELHVEDEDAVGQAAFLLALARWAARRWSPVVSVDGTDGLLLDISGCEHVFGDEARHLGAIERGVRGVGLTARLGVAGTVGAAWAAARFGGSRARLIAPGAERDALAPMPTAALRIDSDAIESLAEVGIDRVGQLLGVPRHTLPARYGADLVRRLDQALGHLPEALERTAEAPVSVVSRELPGGTTHLASVETAVRMLLDEIGGVLGRQESGLGGLEVVFDRLGAGPVRLDVQVSRATRDAAHLWSLLRPKVERLHMGFGVERITLRAGGVVRVPHLQATMAGERDSGLRHDAAFAAMLDTLASRLGRDRVLRPELVSSYRPERSCRLVPVDEKGRAVGAATAPPSVLRPSRLFYPPLAAEVVALSPDGPVLQVRCRREEHRIQSCLGPERIGPEWWREREPVRDYFRVRDDRGRWLWLFVEADTRRWFVHGEWN